MVIVVVVVVIIVVVVVVVVVIITKRNPNKRKTTNKHPIIQTAVPPTIKNFGIINAFPILPSNKFFIFFYLYKSSLKSIRNNGSMKSTTVCILSLEFSKPKSPKKKKWQF